MIVRVIVGSPPGEMIVECNDFVEFEKPCLQCGRPFKTRLADKKYCGDACRWDAQNDRRARSSTVAL